MEGNRRLEVLERQLCAVQLAEAPELIDAAALSAICPKQLQDLLVHGEGGLLAIDNLNMHVSVLECHQHAHAACTQSIC